MTNDEAKQLIQDIGTPWTGRLQLAAWYSVLAEWSFSEAAAHAAALLRTKPADKIGPPDFNRDLDPEVGGWTTEDAAWRSISQWAASVGGWNEALGQLAEYPHDIDEAAAANEVRRVIRYGKEQDARWSFMRMLRSIQTSGKAAQIADRSLVPGLPPTEPVALPSVNTEEALANIEALREGLKEIGRPV